MMNFSIEPPPLRAVRKDHKFVPESQQGFGPPSRPIGDGNNAPDTQLSWILASICQKAADSLGSPSECLSTEDMLSAIDFENQSANKPQNQVMVSLDVIALYPSLESEETSNICALMVTKSGLCLEAIDWEEAALYVTLTGHTGDLPPDCLPQRKYCAGAAPSITTAEVMGPITRNRTTSKFNSPLRSPNSEEKLEIL